MRHYDIIQTHSWKGQWSWPKNGESVPFVCAPLTSLVGVIALYNSDRRYYSYYKPLGVDRRL